MFKIYIDGSQFEETRVVIVDGHAHESHNIVDFAIETTTKSQTRGNIYLGRVEDIQPSLQAIFVNYGEGRYGFLPFSDIHPQYFKLDPAEKKALLESIYGEAENAPDEGDMSFNDQRSALADSDDFAHMSDPEFDRKISQYKIQDVIEKGQPILVQVAKEERGAKGARLTTYLSLAGRCSVFMPNSRRRQRFGVSKKIGGGEERRRLAQIMRALPIGQGTTVILRTAAEQQSKDILEGDFNYLKDLWASIYQSMLAAPIPSKVYEEDNFIQRVIRDMITPDVLEVVVQGEAAYQEAVGYYEKLFQTSAKGVIFQHLESTPLFIKIGVETKLEGLISPKVGLPGGGEIVINQTEALVSIDVNSYRSKQEKNIENTALQNNLEAAEEIARQLRLRDLAGLIVIDFIDMELDASNRKVEETLVRALRKDRAKIQVGSMNEFGLLTVSRQRMRPSVNESMYITCPHCLGIGILPTIQTSSVQMLHHIEEKLLLKPEQKIIVSVPPSVAIYMLNQKRSELERMERTYQAQIIVYGDASLTHVSLSNIIPLMGDHQASKLMNAGHAPFEKVQVSEDDMRAKKLVTSTTVPVQKKGPEPERPSLLKRLLGKKKTEEDAQLRAKRERDLLKNKVQKSSKPISKSEGREPSKSPKREGSAPSANRRRHGRPNKSGGGSRSGGNGGGGGGLTGMAN